MSGQRSVMYVLKALRFVVAWIAAAIARAIFSGDYADDTVFKGRKPAKLTKMVLVFAAVQVPLEIALILVLSGSASNVVAALQQDAFRTAFLVDALLTNAVAYAIIVVAAHVIGNDKLFDYSMEGTRAARALEEIIVAVTGMVYLVPMYMIL